VHTGCRCYENFLTGTVRSSAGLRKVGQAGDSWMFNRLLFVYLFIHSLLSPWLYITVCTDNYVVREHAQDLRTRVESGVHCTSG